MPYTHDGRNRVTLSRDPIDPDSTVWVFFVYQDSLESGETISAHTAEIIGGTIVTQSTALGTRTIGDTSYTDVYGVQISASAGAKNIELTHRVTTTTGGSPDLGRINDDRTAVIPVRQL